MFIILINSTKIQRKINMFSVTSGQKELHFHVSNQYNL